MTALTVSTRGFWYAAASLPPVMIYKFQDDKKTLYSCLLVNRTLSEIIIPILWKNPWKFLKRGKEKLLLGVIILHLSDESKNNLNQNINLFNLLTKSYQKPLFNYISFCRHLNLGKIKKIIYKTIHEDTLFKLPIITNEIIKIFINENTKITHLYIPLEFNFKIHLIPGAQRCFSEIEFLSCKAGINDNVLTGLSEICKSIKIMELTIGRFYNIYDNYGIIRLIEASKNLLNISFLTELPNSNDSFYKILENSLIKHANTIQCFKTTKHPITNLLSTLVNLKRLELNDYNFRSYNYLKNLYLPFLQILKVQCVPSIKDLENLIKNTNGSLIEIKIEFAIRDEINNKRIIQTIYQNCPKLKYLKLLVKNNNILEIENLFINCKYLYKLYIPTNEEFDLDKLFEILIKSSPTSLFKFKFSKYFRTFKTFKLFFDNKKGRHPISLQISSNFVEESESLLQKYKAAGIIESYSYLYDYP
ncbi:hypothetical protein C1645_824747 [Glomus cerebriforme]|uniref:F-box domain-containing protein n=1 Tax=Glomus cerebriforme TaxID=658196 RepID=A0A397T0B5_9GLOM|nr:hypothetical protein C1645_824747 [Glomus cerebriforme]